MSGGADDRSLYADRVRVLELLVLPDYVGWWSESSLRFSGVLKPFLKLLSDQANPAHATQNIDRQTSQTKHGSSHPDSRMKHQAVKDCYERGRKKNRKKYHLNKKYKQLAWWQLMQIRTLGFHESRAENPKHVKLYFIFGSIWAALKMALRDNDTICRMENKHRQHFVQRSFHA